MAYVQKDLDLSGAIAKENSNLIWRRKNSSQALEWGTLAHWL